MFKSNLPALATVAAGLFFMTGCAQSQNAQTQETSTEMTELSYAFGVLFATNLMQEGVNELDTDAVARGFAEQFGGTATLTMEEVNQVLSEGMAALREAQNADYLAECQAFLDENAKKDGVQVTESGLQYEHLVVGDGPSPDASSTVTVHYSGTLIDGTEFDSSYKRGETISFPLGGVIPGWTEGLQLMKVGGKTRFVIPHDLAYGANPNPNSPIPPYATLVFEVELFEVK
jgi:FKBP-type peptidyl-prolyl cis-trans isomerase